MIGKEALAEQLALENGELAEDNPLLSEPAVAPEERKLAIGAARLHFVVGHLEAGFRIVPQRVVLVSAAELFQRQDLARTTRRRQARAIDSFLELREGDLVVHVAHGIGRYRGLRLLEQDGRAEEHLELEYSGGTKIYVPAARIELVQKYVGG